MASALKANFCLAATFTEFVGFGDPVVARLVGSYKLTGLSPRLGTSSSVGRNRYLSLTSSQPSCGSIPRQVLCSPVRTKKGKASGFSGFVFLFIITFD